MKKYIKLIFLVIIAIVVLLSILFLNELNKKNNTSEANNITTREEQMIEDAEVPNVSNEKNVDIEKILEEHKNEIGDIQNLIFDKKYNDNYRFIQTHKGITVHGGGVIATIKNNELLNMVNYNYTIPDDFNTTPLNGKEDLLDIAKDYLKDDNLRLSGSELIIYPINMNEFVLAYIYDFDGIKVIVSDNDKSILASANSINYFNIEKTNLPENTDNKYIDEEDIIENLEKYEQENGKYWIRDKERNIEFYKIKDIYNNIPTAGFLNTTDVYYEKLEFDKDTNWSETDYLSAYIAMDNIGKVYDYYKSRFDFKSITGYDDYNLKVFTNTGIVQGCDYSNNAFLNYIDQNDIRIYIGASNAYNDNIEVIAHEYTHGYFNIITEKYDSNETDTVNEAYADIMALVIEAYYEGKNEIDGILCEEDKSLGRNMKNSNLKYSDYNDDLEYHEASMIISKIAYLISNDKELNLDLDKFAILWFNSLYKLPKHNITLDDVEIAILSQGVEMDLEEEELRKIADIFVLNDFPDYYEQCVNSQTISMRKIEALDVDTAIKMIEENFGNESNGVNVNYEYVATIKGRDGNLYYAINRYAEENFMYHGGEWLGEVSEGKFYAGTYYIRNYYRFDQVHVGYNPRDYEKNQEEDKIDIFLQSYYLNK